MNCLIPVQSGHDVSCETESNMALNKWKKALTEHTYVTKQRLSDYKQCKRWREVNEKRALNCKPLCTDGRKKAVCSGLAGVAAGSGLAAQRPVASQRERGPVSTSWHAAPPRARTPNKLPRIFIMHSGLGPAPLYRECTNICLLCIFYPVHISKTIKPDKNKACCWIARCSEL